MVKRQIGVLVASVVMGALVGCAVADSPGNSEAPGAAGATNLSSECEAAVVKAIEDEQTLYDTHPVWSADIPGPDSTPEQWAEYDVLMADEEAQWQAAYAPIYSTCSSPEEWWVAANKYPRIAGLTDAEFLNPEDLSTWCSNSLDQPACVGIDEWIATNPE